MSIHVFYKAKARRYRGSKVTLHRIEADTGCHVEAISAVTDALKEEKRLRVCSPVLAMIEGGKE